MANMEIAPSPQPTREVLPVFDPENVTGENSGTMPTPQDSEVDREEATMDLQAVRSDPPNLINLSLTPRAGQLGASRFVATVGAFQR